MNMPNGLKDWTADEVAECLSYGKYVEDPNALYRKLYELFEDCKVYWSFYYSGALDEYSGRLTPLGGDGDGGTVEEPAGRLGDYDDKAPNWWRHLSTTDQRAIAKAYADEFGA